MVPLFPPSLCEVWFDSHPRSSLHGTPEHRPAAAAERGLTWCQQYCEWPESHQRVKICMEILRWLISWFKNVCFRLSWPCWPIRCCVLCSARGNSVTHGSQSRSGGGGQMSAEEWRDGGRKSTGEVTVVKWTHTWKTLHWGISYFLLRSAHYSSTVLCSGGPDSTPHCVPSGKNRDCPAAAATHGPSWCCHDQWLHPTSHICQRRAGRDGLCVAGGRGFTLTGYQGGWRSHVFMSVFN